jgi:hypothetical protein
VNPTPHITLTPCTPLPYEVECPVCGYLSNQHYGVNGTGLPCPGALTVCVQCGEILTTATDPTNAAHLILLKPSPSTLRRLRSITDLWRQLNRASELVKQFKRWVPPNNTRPH